MTNLLLSPESLGKVIVLAPHCDDEVLGCGGMLLRCLKNGNQCKAVFFTNELRGGKFFRHLETIEAWRGYPQLEHIFLNIKDANALNHTDTIAETLTSILEVYKPDSIFLPWPFDRHPDHRSAFQVLSLLKMNIDSRIYFYEIFFPLYSNCMMNISGVFLEKETLIDAYISQKKLNLKKVIKYLNDYRAAEMRLCSVREAEAFCAVDFKDVDKVMQQVNIGFLQ